MMWQVELQKEKNEGFVTVLNKSALASTGMLQDKPLKHHARPVVTCNFSPNHRDSMPCLQFSVYDALG